MTVPGYIKSLDGVRAIAILLVMSFHATLTHFGWIGVQLFFVLSGFLITGILWKEKSRPEPLGYKFRKFWVRRSLRIFPVYYAYLLVIGLLYLIFNFPVYFNIYFPYAVTYSINFPTPIIVRPGNPLFSHLWSLAVEEQFYLLFPLIVLLSPPRLAKNLLLFVIVISPLGRYIWGEYYKSKGLTGLGLANSVYFNTFCQLDAFCTGGIIHVLALNIRIKKPVRWMCISLMAVVVAGTINYITSNSPYVFLGDWGYYNYSTVNYQYVWHYTLLNIFFASILLTLISQHSLRWLTIFLENKWMVNIGKVSYGMYIFHWLVWTYLFMKLFNTDSFYIKLALFVPYSIVTYFLAQVSYSLYEVHFINLKDKFFPAGALKKSSTAKIDSTIITSAKSGLGN